MSSDQLPVLAYVDSSVLVAALAPDDVRYHSACEQLMLHANGIVTSVIAEVEVGRALERRKAPRKLRNAAQRLLAGCERVETTKDIRATAIGILPTTVRSLDAIHVATALAVSAHWFISYDVRQQVAAEEAGLTIIRS